MKKLFTRLILTTSLVATSALAFAAPQAAAPTPTPFAGTAQQPSLIPTPPALNAKAYVLMDVNSGTILAQKNMNQERAPASLTKLMTLYLTSRALKNGVININSKVLISKQAWQTGGSRMFLNVGTRVPVGLLTQGVIVDSGNDATMALAQFVGGSISTFVDMMNQEAKALGMTHTHFVDPTGLPAPEHYSSAHDLALLTRAIWLDFPEYHDWYKQKWLTYDGIRQPNRNRLLWRYPYALGMKTGHTKEAGYCLIGLAKKDGTTLLAVSMGTPTDEARADDTQALLSYGFRFFNSHLLYQAGSTITKPRIWYGENKTIPAGTTQDVYATTPRGQFQNAKVSIVTNNNIQAPIKKGQVLGSVNITLNGKTIGSYPLVALTNDAKGGWWRRSTDSISHKFHSWFGSDKKTTAEKPKALANNTNTSANTAKAPVTAAAPVSQQAAQTKTS